MQNTALLDIGHCSSMLLFFEGICEQEKEQDSDSGSLQELSLSNCFSP